MACKCKLLGECTVRSNYADLDLSESYKAHKMKTPGGHEYYRVFFDNDKPELYYNVEENRIHESLPIQS